MNKLMSLPAGTRFGSHEILGPLGQGGMGEVYLAHDTRLHRQVAIKVLHQRLASDPIARARFLREARMAARLEHPNICTLYEIGSEPGFDYLVMQRLGGETLAHRLQRDLPPAGEAIEIAVQLVEALAYAHGHDVLHRDIKPQNVMITPEGSVKLMDFGLAKAIERPDGETSPSERLSEFGEMLGTVEYMSPEQLAGHPADARSDIFSMGLTLYELFSGRHPLARPTRAATIAAITAAAVPPLTSVAPDAPAALEPILARALAANPDDRHQSAAELLAALKGVPIGQAGRSQTPSATPPPSPWWKRPAAIAAGLILVAAIVMAGWSAGGFGARPDSATSAPAEITTWLDIQPVRDGVVQTAYEAAGEIAVETGWRFQVHVQPPGPGHVYVLSDERVRATQETALRILYPTPEQAAEAQRRGTAPFAGPVYTFRAPPADLGLWVVWARTPVRELDALRPLLTADRVGTVNERAQAEEIRRLLVEAAGRVTLDETATRATARTDSGVVVYRFALQQQ